MPMVRSSTRGYFARPRPPRQMTPPPLRPQSTPPSARSSGNSSPGPQEFSQSERGSELADAQTAHRKRRRSGSVLDTELRIDLLEVLVHCAWAETQNLTDVAVGLAARDPGEHLGLAQGER